MTNYMIGDGISTRPHTLADNRRNLESIRISLDTLGEFLERHLSSDRAAALSGAARLRLLSWSISRIKAWTAEEDIAGSYLLLPEYFGTVGIPLPVRCLIRIIESQGEDSLFRKIVSAALALCLRVMKGLRRRGIGIRPLLKAAYEGLRGFRGSLRDGRIIACTTSRPHASFRL